MPNVVPLPLLPPAYGQLELAGTGPRTTAFDEDRSTSVPMISPAARAALRIVRPACVRRESIPQCLCGKLHERRFRSGYIRADSINSGDVRTSPQASGNTTQTSVYSVSDEYPIRTVPGAIVRNMAET